MSSYQYKNSHYKVKTSSILSDIYDGNPHTWKDGLYAIQGPRGFIIITMTTIHYRIVQIFNLLSLRPGSSGITRAIPVVPGRYICLCLAQRNI